MENKHVFQLTKENLREARRLIAWFLDHHHGVLCPLDHKRPVGAIIRADYLIEQTEEQLNNLYESPAGALVVALYQPANLLPNT